MELFHPTYTSFPRSIEPLQGDMCKATLGTYSNLTYADDHLPRTLEEIPGNFAGFRNIDMKQRGFKFKPIFWHISTHFIGSWKETRRIVTRMESSNLKSFKRSLSNFSKNGEKWRLLFIFHPGNPSWFVAEFNKCTVEFRSSNWHCYLFLSSYLNPPRVWNLSPEKPPKTDLKFWHPKRGVWVFHFFCHII